MFKVFASMQFTRSHSLQWLPVNPASSGFRVKPLALPHWRCYISRVQKDALGTIEARLPVDKFEHLFVNTRISEKTGKELGTGKPYTTIMKVWSRLRLKAGLPHFRIHDLRHQYASFLVNAGRTLYEVQQILGHSDPSVTQRYAHLSTKSLQDAANSASLMIRGAMPVAIPMDLPLLVDMAVSEPVEVAVAG